MTLSTANLVKGLRLAAREAAECGVTLMVQNHHDLACHHDQFVTLLEDVGESNVRAAFDAWAPHLQGVRGEELVRAVEKVGPWIEFTTVADYEIQARFRYDAQRVTTFAKSRLTCVPSRRGAVKSIIRLSSKGSGERGIKVRSRTRCAQR